MSIRMFNKLEIDSDFKALWIANIKNILLMQAYGKKY